MLSLLICSKVITLKCFTIILRCLCRYVNLFDWYSVLREPWLRKRKWDGNIDLKFIADNRKFEKVRSFENTNKLYLLIKWLALLICQGSRFQDKRQGSRRYTPKNCYDKKMLNIYGQKNLPKCLVQRFSTLEAWRPTKEYCKNVFLGLY